MMLSPLLQYSAACFCVGAAIFALTRDHRSFVHRVFALGMVTLALESFFTGLSAQAVFPRQAIRWQEWRFGAAALVPGIWLIFGLSFGRGDYRRLLSKWKWVILAVFLVHLAFVTLLQADFFRDGSIDQGAGWEFGLGRSGYGFHVGFLLSLVLILMVLERILRAMKGRKRWQFKFLLLGIVAFFAARIYTGSHTLLYQTMNLELEAINAAALLVANFLILISILRAGVLQVDIYLSHGMLYNSLTAIVVGVYFSALGLSVKTLTQYLSFPLRALIVFLALLGLLMAMLSDRVRLRMKNLVSSHLRRPQYDYRNVWMAFTNRTGSLVEEKPLCETVVKMISEMFDSLSVSLWLLDEKRGGLRCAASTVFSETQVRNFPQLQNGTSDLVQVLRGQRTLLDLNSPGGVDAAEITPSRADFLREARIRYAVPVTAGDDLMAFISLGDRVKGQPFSLEELDLLRTIAHQVAASLLNLRLSERLRQGKELEAFQTVAAFFVHDLKNLASKLSMMLRNLPNHFGNPEFRQDALRLMSLSVDQVNDICGRLSLLRGKLEMRPAEIDLNQVVKDTLSNLNGSLAGCNLVENLQAVPKLFADPEQIQKVLTNLILNAGDAVRGDGEIRVTTGTRNGWAEFTVKDTGCGMSHDFMDHCLFRPFRTTKPNGTGIGLFQSKMIVEAHKGLLEVESREGRGSTFKVLLPVKEHRA
jgi:putative PEP-CTERM system histidine kinase